MAHEELALRSAAEIGAWSVAVAGAALLTLALAAELVRRVRSGSVLVALADRLLPTPWRRTAAAVVTILSAALALAVPSGARADEHHTRSWLVDGATTSTTTGAPATSTSTSTRSPTTTTTTSTTTPVELVPPTVVRNAPATPTQPVVPPRPAPVLGPLVAPPAPVATPRPVSGPPRVAAGVPPRVAATAAPSYTVVPGDCLWSIAARILGGRATGSAVDRGWRAIYAANREAIGSDPNLIHPGLVLSLPPLDPTP
jgi:LysM repeat protein